MSLRSRTISKLLTERSSRESYIRAKLNHLIPSQIKALRLNEGWTQQQMADEAGMKQARISAMEKPGGGAFTIETLVRLAAAFRVGLQVRFVPNSEMLKWDNAYSQDDFVVTPIEVDKEFLSPSPIMNFSYIEATGIPPQISTGICTPSLPGPIETNFYAPASLSKSERVCAA